MVTDTCTECGTSHGNHLASCSKIAWKPADGEPVTPAPLGTHLASLNLFREADGRLYITVASATGALAERDGLAPDMLGLDYVMTLVGQAENVR